MKELTVQIYNPSHQLIFEGDAEEFNQLREDGLVNWNDQIVWF